MCQNSRCREFLNAIRQELLIFYEHLSENKPSNFPVPLVSEQHNYFNLHAVLPLNNCSTLLLLASITGMPSLFVFETQQQKPLVEKHFVNIILLSISLFLTAFSSVSGCVPCVS